MRLPIIVILLLLLAVLLLGAPVFAQPIPNAKSNGVTIGPASTQVLVANDLALGIGRDYLMIQCTGATTCYCCIGTNNNCSTLNGTALAASTGAWILTSVSRTNGIIIPAPAGDVACVTASGNSQVVTLDY
jgi:hypothetical protein